METCKECKKGKIHYKKRGLCLSCYQKLRRERKLEQTTTRYESEMDFIKYYFTHSNWLYQPVIFRLKECNYTPDFYDGERNVFIEVAGSRQAYHANKTVYQLFRDTFPKLNFEIRQPSGKILDEDSKEKNWE